MSNNRNRNNKRGRDNDNQASTNAVQNNNNKAHKEIGNSYASTANTGGGGRGGNSHCDRGHCHIQGHENMHHDWRGCHLNPFARHYDSKAWQDFDNNKAHGPNVWYRDILLQPQPRGRSPPRVAATIANSWPRSLGLSEGRSKPRTPPPCDGAAQPQPQRHSGTANKSRPRITEPWSRPRPHSRSPTRTRRPRLSRTTTTKPRRDIHRWQCRDRTSSRPRPRCRGRGATATSLAMAAVAATLAVRADRCRGYHRRPSLPPWT